MLRHDVCLERNAITEFFVCNRVSRKKIGKPFNSNMCTDQYRTKERDTVFEKLGISTWSYIGKRETVNHLKKKKNRFARRKIIYILDNLFIRRRVFLSYSCWTFYVNRSEKTLRSSINAIIVAPSKLLTGIIILYCEHSSACTPASRQRKWRDPNYVFFSSNRTCRIANLRSKWIPYAN